MRLERCEAAQGLGILFTVALGSSLDARRPPWQNRVTNDRVMMLAKFISALEETELHLLQSQNLYGFVNQDYIGP